jgi:four helix bundle protein
VPRGNCELIRKTVEELAINKDHLILVLQCRARKLNKIKMAAGNFRSLTVYKKAFALAMDIFEVSKAFPKEEKYSLTDQIRRSSRSVCVNVGEGYRKRQYEAYFVSKSSDGDMENTETRIWLDFALSCLYLNEEKWSTFDARAEEIGRLLNHMIENPKSYQRKGKG